MTCRPSLRRVRGIHGGVQALRIRPCHGLFDETVCMSAPCKGHSGGNATSGHWLICCCSGCQQRDSAG
eukprot:2071740-Alexandrium_andersonii.AAC.1